MTPTDRYGPNDRYAPRRRITPTPEERRYLVAGPDLLAVARGVLWLAENIHHWNDPMFRQLFEDVVNHAREAHATATREE